MSRSIQSRLRFQGTMEALRPLHVGGLEKDAAVDLSLAVNGRDQVYLPGSSLAGALRAWMEREFGEAETHRLWGYQNLRRQPDGQRGGSEHASYVLVEDAVICLPGGKTMAAYEMEIRNGVGIDRQWGTAADRIQFSRAVIPRGAIFPLEFAIEINSKENEKAIKDAFDYLLCGLTEGLIRLGAAKTRGLGWVKLQEQYAVHEERCDRQGLLDRLTHKLKVYQPTTRPATHLNQLTVRLKWRSIGPLMVKADQSGVAVDILPLMGSVGVNQLAFVVPGSAIKGALRSQAERMIRTVLDQPLNGKNFSAQIEAPPLITTLFGKAAQEMRARGESTNGKVDPSIEMPSVSARANPEASSENRPPVQGLSALRVEDCYSQHGDQPIGVDTWQAVTAATQKELQDKLKDANLHTTQQAFHVAVDRWTGGAADQFLYTNLEPFDLNWEDLHFTLDFARIPQSDWLPAVALLLLVLRDLIERRIPLGYGVNRGMGAIAIQSLCFTVSGSDLPEEVKFLNQKTLSANPYLTQNDLAQLGDLTALNHAWGVWRTSASHQEVSQ